LGSDLLLLLERFGIFLRYLFGKRQTSESTLRTPFVGSRLKIKRANKHILEFDTIRKDFLKGDFYRVFIDTKTDPGMSGLKMETNALPPDVPVVIGDAIHNLHSALDLLAYQIALEGGSSGDLLEKVQFPFSKKRQDLIGALKGGEIKVAGKTVIDLIVNEVKPYPSSEGGNEQVWALHRLDIVDKHRLLIPMVTVTKVTGINAEDDRGNTVQNLTLVLTGSGTMGAVTTSGNLKITDKGKASGEITFREAGFFEGEAVLPTLKQLSQLIAGFVDAIEKVYLAGGK
jgi:hypothetical protein